MRITEHKLIFEQSDLAFVEKFGVADAANMVLDYKTTHATPFVYDVNQLSRLLLLGVKDLFALSKTCDTAYHTILLKKKNGQYRELNAPDDRLKRCQAMILRKILSKMPVSAYATAYRAGGTLAQNAAPHMGKRYLLKLDITDFFGSICFEQVYNAAFHTGYYPRQIGVILTKLCCKNGVLPQGAPTSPALSNLVMRNFDDNIGRWCRSRAIAYTRYCDDMTFSSDQPLYAVYQKVSAMLEDSGLEVNEKKTRFVTNAARQSVTGLTVNEKVAVSRDYKRALRQEIYYVLKFGLAEHILRSSKAEFLVDGSPSVRRYYQNLLGRIAFVLQIEPENVWFQTALTQLRGSKRLQDERMLRSS